MDRRQTSAVEQPTTPVRQPRWEFLVPFVGMLFLALYCGNATFAFDSNLYQTPTPLPPTISLDGPLGRDPDGLDIPGDVPAPYSTQGLGMAMLAWQSLHGVPEQVFSPHEALFDHDRYHVLFWPDADYPISRIDRRLPANGSLSFDQAAAEAHGLLPADSVLLKVLRLSAPIDGPIDRIVEVFRAPSLINRYSGEYLWGTANTPGFITLEYRLPTNIWSMYAGLAQDP